MWFVLGSSSSGGLDGVTIPGDSYEYTVYVAVNGAEIDIAAAQVATGTTAFP